MPQLYLARRGCEQFDAISVVEYVPYNIYNLDATMLPQCVWLQLALRFVEFLDWLEAPLGRGDGPDALYRSLMLCDWKMDQFGLTEHMELKLVDVDSLQWFHAQLPLNADAKCKSGVAPRLRRSCAGGAECLQHLVRVFRAAPEEFWCNNATEMCDGFDTASNVYGFAVTVLRPLFNEAEANFDPSIRRRINATLDSMTTYRRKNRARPAALLETFGELFAEAGGDKCARAFRKLGGVEAATKARANYDTTAARMRFGVPLEGPDVLVFDSDGDSDSDSGDDDGAGAAAAAVDAGGDKRDDSSAERSARRKMREQRRKNGAD